MSELAEATALGANRQGRSKKTAVVAPHPLADVPLRFAVGSPVGRSSNSWRVWANGSDLYIACRDNFQQTKVSLHASGRWRMGFTQEAVGTLGSFWPPERDRAWDVWEKPPEIVPGLTMAFHLIFLTHHLLLKPSDRVGKFWKDPVYYVPEGKPGHLVMVSIMLTAPGPLPVAASGQSIVLASYRLGAEVVAHVVAHEQPEETFAGMVERSLSEGYAHVEANQIALPEETYAYFLGIDDQGCRVLFSARMGTAG